MRELYNMRLWGLSVGLFASSAIERGITTYIDRQLNLLETSPALYHIISIFLLVVLFIATSRIIGLLIHWSFVSRLFFLFNSNKYIGGLWVEIVLQEKDGQNVVDHYSVLTIDYDIDKISLEGETYTPNFGWLYNLNTKCSSMSDDNHSLHYIFECSDKPYPDFGTITFIKKTGGKARPDRYQGAYKIGDERYSVEGFLISDRKSIKKLKADEAKALEEIVGNFQKK